MELRRYYSEITKRFGRVKRARGNFLYTEKGIRVTDMYLEAGRAILGWGSNNGTTGSGAFTFFKNVIARGLTGSFENDFVPQLDKAAESLLGKKVKVFACNNLSCAIQLCAKTGKKHCVYVPFTGAVKLDENNFYNSFASDAAVEKDFDSCIVVPPFAWSTELFLVCADSTLQIDDQQLDTVLINGCTASAVSRGLYDLCKKQKSLSEKNFFIYDKELTKYWTRKGPYLYPKCKKEEYDEFVLWCLDRGYAVSPEYEIPSIVPYGADKGAVKLSGEIKWIRV